MYSETATEEDFLTGTGTASAASLILSVGNSMMGDDGAGPLLAGCLLADPVPGWEAIDGGSAPENVVHAVLARRPERVVVVDAADMGLEPGDIRLVDDRAIADMFIMSTHNLPLSFLIERLREQVADVRFIGIQPDVVAFYCPMTPRVEAAVHRLHALLRSDDGLDAIPFLSSDQG